MLIARDYQIAAHKSIYNYFEQKNGFPLLALPTGTGKSIIIAEFVKGVIASYPSSKIIIATHVKELIAQNLDKLMRMWPECNAGVYSAGLKSRDIGNSVIFAGIASVAKKASIFGKVDLLLIDEAHLVSDKGVTMYRSFILALLEINPMLKVIGLTATAYRLGLGSLTNGGLFTDVCFDLTTKEGFAWLVEQGYLARLIPKRPGMEYDLTKVKLSGGEYVLKQLQEEVNKDALTHQAVKEIIMSGAERKHWLIFATGIEHSVKVKEAFELYGIPATVVHSKLTDDERVEALEGHRTGKYRVIVNNNVLTTGYDFPDIDLIGVLRPTKSSGLHVQMLGRGTRPVYAEGYDLTTSTGRNAAIAAGPKQNCLVLDFAGNTKFLGPINDPVLPKKKGEGGGEGVAPVKVCEKCGTYNHASVRVCECCGVEFPKVLKISGIAYTDEVFIDKAAIVIKPFRVDRISYRRHEKPGKPLPTMKVTYFCGLRMFTEWICVEHPEDSFPRDKAETWWAKRHSSDLPATVDEALNVSKNLLQPSTISVKLNQKFPEITDYAFK